MVQLALWADGKNVSRKRGETELLFVPDCSLLAAMLAFSLVVPMIDESLTVKTLAHVLCKLLLLMSMSFWRSFSV
jgi:hypothetical protein